MNRVLKAIFFIFAIGGNLIFAMEQEDSGPLQIKVTHEVGNFRQLRKEKTKKRMKARFAASTRLRKSVDLFQEEEFNVPNGESAFLRLVPNSKCVAVGRSVPDPVYINRDIISLYNISTGKKEADVNKENPLSDADVNCIDVSKDGKQLLAGSGIVSACLYDIERCSLVQEFKYRDKNDLPYWIGFINNGNETLIGFDMVVYKYDMRSGNFIEKYDGDYSYPSPDYTVAGVPEYTDDYKSVQFLITEIQSGREIGRSVTMQNPEHKIWGAPALGPKNQELAIYNVMPSTGNVVVSNFEENQISVCKAENQPWVKCPTFSPDGKTIAVGTGGAVNIFETSNGVLQKTLPVNGCPMNIEWNEKALAVVTYPDQAPYTYGTVYIFNNEDLSSLPVADATKEENASGYSIQ